MNIFNKLLSSPSLHAPPKLTIGSKQTTDPCRSRLLTPLPTPPASSADTNQINQSTPSADFQEPTPSQSPPNRNNLIKLRQTSKSTNSTQSQSNLIPLQRISVKPKSTPTIPPSSKRLSSSISGFPNSASERRRRWTGKGSQKKWRGGEAKVRK